MAKTSGWYNGFNVDIDVYTDPTVGGAWFRVWDAGYFTPARCFIQTTLGL